MIDGVYQVLANARDDGYPRFTRGRFVHTGRDRVWVEAVNITVEVGQARVNPRDIVVADANGALVVPQVRAREVPEFAGKIEGIKNETGRGRRGSPRMRGTGDCRLQGRNRRRGPRRSRAFRYGSRRPPLSRFSEAVRAGEEAPPRGRASLSSPGPRWWAAGRVDPGGDATLGLTQIVLWAALSS